MHIGLCAYMQLILNCMRSVLVATYYHLEGGEWCLDGCLMECMAQASYPILLVYTYDQRTVNFVVISSQSLQGSVKR